MVLKEKPLKSFVRFFHTYLDPAERLSEVLFGLIMVISITGTVNLILPSEENSVRTLFKAAIGCNTAWGIVDGVLYVLNSVMHRSQRLKIIQKVRQTKNFQEALPLIADRLDSMMSPLVESVDRERLYQAIYKNLSKVPLEKGRLLKEDLLGAVASFFLVFLSTFPVTIPFLVISNPHLALNISNLIGLTLLFIVGYRRGHFAMVRPLRPAFGMVLIGGTLIFITKLLGG